MASRMMLVQSVATKDRQQWEHLVQGLVALEWGGDVLDGLVL